MPNADWESNSAHHDDWGLKNSQKIEYLKWGNLRIIQDETLPRFSLDAVLLADFATVPPHGEIADLGTGTGIIPLLLHARNPLCKVYALELMPQMVELAQKSVNLNDLSRRIKVVCGDICRAGELMGKGAFDLVVCNPPYFLSGCGHVSRDPLRAAARAEIHCCLEDVVREGAVLLKDQGRLAFCQRPARLEEALRLLYKYQITPLRLRMVRSFANANPEHFLIEGIKGAKGQLETLPPLTVYQTPACYSEEAAAIFEGRNCLEARCIE